MIPDSRRKGKGAGIGACLLIITAVITCPLYGGEPANPSMLKASRFAVQISSGMQLAGGEGWTESLEHRVLYNGMFRYYALPHYAVETTWQFAPVNGLDIRSTPLGTGLADVSVSNMTLGVRGYWRKTGLRPFLAGGFGWYRTNLKVQLADTGSPGGILLPDFVKGKSDDFGVYIGPGLEVAVNRYLGVDWNVQYHAFTASLKDNQDDDMVYLQFGMGLNIYFW